MTLLFNAVRCGTIYASFAVTTVQANENDVSDEGILPASEGT